MRLNPHSPVLARGGGAVQVGLAAPAVLRGLGSEERAFVASLEGGRPVSAAQARRFSRVITRLTNAGAWWEPPAVACASVAVHGCGRLGMAIAAALADSGLGVTLHDDAPSGAEEAGLYVQHEGTCAGAAAATLALRGLRPRVGGAGESVAVVTCVGSPDPVLVARLLRTDTPHIVVACTESEAWISHVVVPGTSPCLRCRDLALSRADPEWPLVALQLSGPSQRGRRPRTSDTARPVIAGMVCALVGGWLHAGDPGNAMVVGDDGRMRVSEVLADPACGCGAAAGAVDRFAVERAQLVAD